MSYDVNFVIDTGGDTPVEIDTLNYTYNCGPMFRLAIGGDGLNELHDKRAGDLIAKLREAVAHISYVENRERYAAMNPENGWGSHDGATAFLRGILARCEAHPKATVTVT